MSFQKLKEEQEVDLEKGSINAELPSVYLPEESTTPAPASSNDAEKNDAKEEPGCWPWEFSITRLILLPWFYHILHRERCRFLTPLWLLLAFPIWITAFLIDIGCSIGWFLLRGIFGVLSLFCFCSLERLRFWMGIPFQKWPWHRGCFQTEWDEDHVLAETGTENVRFDSYNSYHLFQLKMLFLFSRGFLGRLCGCSSKPDVDPLTKGKRIMFIVLFPIIMAVMLVLDLLVLVWQVAILASTIAFLPLFFATTMMCHERMTLKRYLFYTTRFLIAVVIVAAIAGLAMGGGVVIVPIFTSSRKSKKSSQPTENSPIATTTPTPTGNEAKEKDAVDIMNDFKK